MDAIRMIITLVVSFAAAIFVVVRGTNKNVINGKGNKKHQFIENAKSKGYVVTANHTQSTYIPGDMNSNTDYNRYPSYKVTYEYTIDGVRYQKKLTFQSPASAIIDYPLDVDVYYDPKAPAKGVTVYDAGSKVRSAGCFVTGLMGVGTFLLVAVLLTLILGG